MKRIQFGILCLAIYCTGFGQVNNIEGIWKEYKREIVGETNPDDFSINLADLHLYHDYKFFSNSEYKDYGNTAHALFHFKDNGSYSIKGDTLKLYESVDSDSDNTKQFPEIYLISYPTTGELVLTSVCKPDQFGYIHYFKKAKKANKSKYVKEYGHPKPAEFPGGLGYFISKNISDSLQLDNVKGSEHDVDVLLSINAEGKVTSATYVRENKHPMKAELKEVIRLVRMMPKWIPATDDRNRKVESKQLISVSFAK